MRLRILALTALAAATASSANAAIMLATWTSTISRVGAPQKIAPGPDLVGSPFVMRLTYDTELGSRSGVKEPGELSVTLATDKTQPLLTASIAFGGETYDLDVRKADWNLTQGSENRFPSFARTSLEAGGDIGGETYLLTLDLLAIAGPDAITLDFKAPYSTNVWGVGGLLFKPDGGAANTLEMRFVADERRPGTLSVVRLDPPTAVPEPTTWALMILGFGGVGAALRRRPALA